MSYIGITKWLFRFAWIRQERWDRSVQNMNSVTMCLGRSMISDNETELCRSGNIITLEFRGALPDTISCLPYTHHCFSSQIMILNGTHTLKRTQSEQGVLPISEYNHTPPLLPNSAIPLSHTPISSQIPTHRPHHCRPQTITPI